MKLRFKVVTDYDNMETYLVDNETGERGSDCRIKEVWQHGDEQENKTVIYIELEADLSENEIIGLFGGEELCPISKTLLRNIEIPS